MKVQWSLVTKGAEVAASMMDKDGRELFLGAQFSYSEDSACSESYRFCFEPDGVARLE